MDDVWIVVVVVSVLWMIGMGYSLTTVNTPGRAVMRITLWCEDLKKQAEVEFFSREGVPVGIRRCSLMKGEELTCRQRCLVTAVVYGM